MVALGVALAFSDTQSSAQEHANGPHPVETGAAQPTLAHLESIFWVCDHAATREVLDPDTAAACAAHTSDFRRRKFDGDLDALLEWWQRNKAHQHHLLDMRYRTAGHR